MVRRRTQLKRIENAASRQVTFSKRRNGLLKKAFELSVLCDAEVALIIFSPRGKLYEFSSSSTNKTIERYQKRQKDIHGISSKGEDMQKDDVKEDAHRLAKKIESLEDSKRKLLGHGLEPCSIDDLLLLEKQLERSLSRIRARKNQVFTEQIEKLKEEERRLGEENANLREECGMRPRESTSTRQSDDERNMEVETELCIGPPERRCILKP
ncbi:agamous-like MADS-box protein AGL19 isoform X1 [Gossypium hirsutum]|uniref:Agamous-like MADS-box protein AGL19 isoform X1 n=1 Tax=Gossypium hirsutum TaxID=3635 RepID=A0ABM2Z9V8_GOSHI|nr:agamous-like MADS-box protein AGL19 isoform X1 [Gossypium hirsutum]XP_040939461.1 agamous-like MADS-box protein AGL19 isoform X1 [Gossypium hirsutum]XP_040939462.1 agamous-like MADS-box protein AGL19 isoform X1 [Gossypium hirsutum]